MTRVYIGLGANLGDRLASLARALDGLDATPGVRVAAVSSAYETEPWGITDQPPFANAVAALDVDLSAAGLLAVLKRLEQEAGRAAGPRNGPRPLDLDILLFGEQRIAEPGLTVPHPRMLERDFVVTPLLEIAPDAVLPDGRRIADADPHEGRVTGVLTNDLRGHGVSADPAGPPVA